MRPPHEDAFDAVYASTGHVVIEKLAGRKVKRLDDVDVPLAGKA